MVKSSIYIYFFFRVRSLNCSFDKFPACTENSGPLPRSKTKLSATHWLALTWQTVQGRFLFFFFSPPEVDVSPILIFKFVVSYLIGFSFTNVCFFNLKYDENNTTFRKVQIWLLIFWCCRNPFLMICLFLRRGGGGNSRAKTNIKNNNNYVRVRRALLQQGKEWEVSFELRGVLMLVLFIVSFIQTLHVLFPGRKLLVRDSSM